MLRICFNLGLAGITVLAASIGLRAAPMTSVVRADPHSGKLVRVVVGVPSDSADGAFSAAVERIAAEHALPAGLIRSVIQAESNYNPFAISPKGALGIMQLVPETARRFGVSNAFNAEQNIEGGAKYLKYLLDRYPGDYPLVLAAYNAGEGAVARHGGVPPYPETQKYVKKVLARFPKATAPKAAPVEHPAAGKPEYNHIQQIVEPDGRVRYVSS